MKTPKVAEVDFHDTHRLIPYRYAEGERPILDLLAEGDGDFLQDLTELEGATNDRLLAESGRLPGVSAIELVSGFPLAHIVNASFAHPRPHGSRFNDGTRGAWYAALAIETSQIEVAYHKAIELKEVGWMNREEFEYVDYLADFRHAFHDIRRDKTFIECLDPDSYAESQALGRQLLTSGSPGVVYPSVRHKGGVCIVCFRPPLVLNVRKGRIFALTFVGGELKAVR